MSQAGGPKKSGLKEILNQIQEAIRDGYHANAQQLVSDAQQRFPKHTGLLKLKADVAEANQLWEEAIKFRRLAVKHSPPDRLFVHHTLMTRTFLNKGEHHRCRKRILHELSIWADKPMVISTAKAYVNTTGDVKIIVPVLREKVFRGKADKYSAIYLARIQRQSASPQNALTTVQKGLVDNPDDLDLSFHEALAAFAIGDFQLTRILVKKLIQRSDCTAEIKTKLTKKLVAMGELSGIKPTKLINSSTPSELNDNGEEIIIHRVIDSNKVLLVFTGMLKQGGLSLRELHRFIAPSNTNIIYLRDTRLLAFTCGLKSKGSCLSETINWLQSLFKEWDIKDVLCFGNSAGGFSAIRYGIELGAVRILVFSAPTSLTPEVLINDKRGRIFIGRIQKLAPTEAIDLRDQILSRQFRDDFKLILYYGAEMPEDAMHAKRLENIPKVYLHPIEGYEKHNVICKVAEMGCLEEAFAELVQCKT